MKVVFLNCTEYSLTFPDQSWIHKIDPVVIRETRRCHSKRSQFHRESRGIFWPNNILESRDSAVRLPLHLHAPVSSTRGFQLIFGPITTLHHNEAPEVTQQVSLSSLVPWLDSEGRHQVYGNNTPGRSRRRSVYRYQWITVHRPTLSTRLVQCMSAWRSLLSQPCLHYVPCLHSCAALPPPP